MHKSGDAETIFPTKLLVELIEILKGREAEFITYSELAVPRLFPPALALPNYILEAVRFKVRGARSYSAKLRSCLGTFARLGGLRSFSLETDRPPQVLLQHDADRKPHNTLQVMQIERRLGVVSSNFFFYERNIWDGDDEPYELDVASLQELEQCGFEIGYHLNALELAGYDLAKARSIVARDVRWFAQHFNLRTFVPHGGQPGPNGTNNDTVPYEPPLTELLWAYNGRGLHGVFKDVTWTDGRIYGQKLPDPREIARTLGRGQRVLFLMHPQYYGDVMMPEALQLPIATQSWWRELWNLPPLVASGEEIEGEGELLPQ